MTTVDPNPPYMTILMFGRRYTDERRAVPVPLHIQSKWSAVILFSMARKLILAQARKRETRELRRAALQFADRAGSLLDRAGFERTDDVFADVLGALDEIADEFEAEESEQNG